MSKKQKLELTWNGKENRPGLEPRILLEGPVDGREKAQETQNCISDSAPFALLRG